MTSFRPMPEPRDRSWRTLPVVTLNDHGLPPWKIETLRRLGLTTLAAVADAFRRGELKIDEAAALRRFLAKRQQVEQAQREGEHADERTD